MSRRIFVRVLLILSMFSVLTILPSMPLPYLFTGNQSALEQIVVAQSMTGIATIVALNQPPSILNASLGTEISGAPNLDGNTPLVPRTSTLRTLISDPNSLVDVDNVVVYVFNHSDTYAFKWIRRGSHSPPGNCRTAYGCWYELKGNSWTTSYTYLDDTRSHHDAITNRITSGEWVFTITVPILPDSVNGSCWNYQVDVADRSNATARNSGSLPCSMP
jgi:hypothetical protein